MKRPTALALATLLSLSLGSCASTEQTSPQIEAETAEQAAEVPLEPVEESASQVTVEEKTLLDEDELTISFVDIAHTDFETEVYFLIENHMGRDIIVQTRGVSVNGFMVDGNLSVDLSAGKKASPPFYLMQDELDRLGITTIADMELTFVAIDPSNFNTLYTSPKVNLTTSAAESFAQPENDSGSLVYDKGGVKVEVKGLVADNGNMESELVLSIVNGSENDITVQAGNTSVNGMMIDPIFSAEVSAGKRAESGMAFMQDDLRRNSIGSITEVSFKLQVFEGDAIDRFDTSEQITVTF